MANHIKITQLPDADRAELQRRVASMSLPARDVERARIVLLAADGLGRGRSPSGWVALNPR